VSVLERVSPEVRRKTGWILPVVIGAVLSEVVPGTTTLISQSERLGSGCLVLVGLLGGWLWQWYSPRDLAQRLVFPAGASVLLAVIFMVPGGELTHHGPTYAYWFPLGLIAGLVLTTRWQQLRAED
jgi:hypothetical protein